MKCNALQLGASFLATMILAACSGGGGGSNPPAEQQAKPVQPTMPVQPSTPAQPTTPNQPSMPNQPVKPVQPSTSVDMPLKGTGAVLVVKDEDENVAYEKTVLDSSDLTKINVEGISIPLSKGYQNSINSTVHVFNQEDGYKHARFGAVASHEAGRSDIIFYNGNPTVNMPNEGVVTYKGNSILTDNGEAIADDYMTGTSSFTADFGNKKLNGELNVRSDDVNVNVAVKVEADISGNSFAGSATSAQFTTQGKSEGRFYGDNAKELAGFVKADDNSWAGAYGAKKQ